MDAAALEFYGLSVYPEAMDRIQLQFANTNLSFASVQFFPLAFQNSLTQVKLGILRIPQHGILYIEPLAHHNGIIRLEAEFSGGFCSHFSGRGLQNCTHITVAEPGSGMIDGGFHLQNSQIRLHLQSCNPNTVRGNMEGRAGH